MDLSKNSTGYHLYSGLFILYIIWIIFFTPCLIIKRPKQFPQSRQIIRTMSKLTCSWSEHLNKGKHCTFLCNNITYSTLTASLTASGNIFYLPILKINLPVCNGPLFHLRQCKVMDSPQDIHCTNMSNMEPGHQLCDWNAMAGGVPWNLFSCHCLSSAERCSCICMESLWFHACHMTELYVYRSTAMLLLWRRVTYVCMCAPVGVHFVEYHSQTKKHSL